MNDEIKEMLIKRAEGLRPESKWFYGEKLQIYIRAGKQFTYDKDNPGFVLAVTVSNVEITDSAFLRKGIYQGVVDQMIADAKELGYTQFQVENTLSPQMHGFVNKMKMKVKPSPYGSLPSHWLDL